MENQVSRVNAFPVCWAEESKIHAHQARVFLDGVFRYTVYISHCLITPASSAGIESPRQCAPSRFFRFPPNPQSSATALECGETNRALLCPRKFHGVFDIYCIAVRSRLRPASSVTHNRLTSPDPMSPLHCNPEDPAPFAGRLPANRARCRFTRLLDPLANLCRWLAHLVARQLFVIHPRHLDMNVDPVQKRTADSILIAHHSGERVYSLTRSPNQP